MHLMRCEGKSLRLYLHPRTLNNHTRKTQHNPSIKFRGPLYLSLLMKMGRLTTWTAFLATPVYIALFSIFSLLHPLLHPPLHPFCDLLPLTSRFQSTKRANQMEMVCSIDQLSKYLTRRLVQHTCLEAHL